MRYLLILSLIMLLVSVELSAQISISGVLRERDTKEAIPDVNVLLRTKDGKSIHSYTTTGEDGSYKLSYSGIADSLMINFMGLGIKAQTVVVPARSQVVDALIEREALAIREVVIKSEPVVRSSDTLKYYVSHYIDSIDHSIGDVLRKMPGIDVAKSGRIQYYGRDINRFYIEGMDMLKGRYGIATNNIQARDIATVEVLENHQPIRALREIINNDGTAINLKLKDEKRGVFSSTIEVGGGYKPAMWSGEIAAMYFEREFQTLNTYKTNNSGSDVSRELRSFYGEMDMERSILSVMSPSTPPVDNERFLNNNVHALSLNSIRKLNNEYELSVNGKYLHDIQKSRASSVTTYFLPETSELVITEQSSASYREDDAEVSLELSANTDNIYLKENLSFGAAWNSDYGMIDNLSNAIDQNFKMSSIRLRNDFSIVKPLRSVILNVYSTTSFNSSPSTLRISPLLYPEMFGLAEGDSENTVQHLDSRIFRTRNSITTHKDIGQWSFSCSAAFNAEIQRMKSSLVPTDNIGTVYSPADSLKNDINWEKFNFVITPGITYKINRESSIRLYFPVDFMNLNINDDVLDRSNNKKAIFLRPSAAFTTAISRNLRFSVNASLNESIGDLYDTYSGYIMTNYRTIVNSSGNIRESQYQNYSANLNYGNPIRSLLGSLEGAFTKRSSNVMYGTVYAGTLSKIESYSIDNTSQSYRLNGRIGKRFNDIRTTVTLSGSYNHTLQDVLRQGSIMNTEYRVLNAGIELSSWVGKVFRLDYQANYIQNRAKVSNNNSTLKPINTFVQISNLNFVITESLTLRLMGEHYFNGYISHGDRSMFFLDAEINYKVKKFEYTLQARNMFNTRNFNSASYSDITSYVYAYQLRPSSVIFKVKYIIN